MPLIAQLRDLDSRAWCTATWGAPFTVEIVVGAMVIVLWLLGKTQRFFPHDRAWFLTGTVITALASALTSGLLLTSASSRVRGIALSVAGSAVVVLVGGILLAFYWYG
ncbi:MAG: hypothetical protein ACRDTV_07555 [Mycobacterium sp.]